MSDLNPVNPVAMSVFIAFFLLVTVVGFFAARWKRGDLTQLHEWGLGGPPVRNGDFLVPGRRRFLYGLYGVIAVPALVYSVGAYGFFALPYTIIVYPFVFAVMPKLWKIAHAKNHITAADYVQGEYGGKWFPAAVAITRHCRDHALYRAATGRDASGDQGPGRKWRNAVDRRIR